MAKAAARAHCKSGLELYVTALSDLPAAKVNLVVLFQ